MSDYKLVKEFHEVFDRNPIPESPTIPDHNTILLRLQLIEEEVAESREILNDLLYFEFVHGRSPTKEEQKEALCKLAKEWSDILYVVHGAGLAFGIDLDKAFPEVHRSNMTKLPKDGVILRREDGKVQKPDTYEQADMEGVLYDSKNI